MKMVKKKKKSSSGLFQLFIFQLILFFRINSSPFHIILQAEPRNPKNTKGNILAKQKTGNATQIQKHDSKNEQMH